MGADKDGGVKSTKRGLKAQLVAARKAHKLERRRRKAWQEEQAEFYLQRVQELRSERDELYCKLNEPAPTTQVWRGKDQRWLLRRLARRQ
jgi:hypothetical protein